MFMVKVPQQVKNMVIDWLTEEGRPFTDITNEEKIRNPQIEFVIQINGRNFPLFVYTHSQLPTRLLMDMPIIFGGQHPEITQQYTDDEWKAFVLKLNDRMAAWGVEWSYEQEEKKINRLVMHDFIDYDAISRYEFNQKTSKSTIRIMHMTRTIGFLLGTDTQPVTDMGTPGSGPYR